MTDAAQIFTPEPIGTPITGPVAWTQATLAPDDGHFALPPACLQELEAVAEAVKAHPLPVVARAPADFDLAACRAFMAEVGRGLADGVGFALIDRLPVERWGADTAVAVYWLLCSLLSRPVAQKWDGTLVYDVEDTGRPPGNGVRPDKTNAEQNFHTDNSYNLCPPEHVCLLCIRPAVDGGVSRILSFASAHNTSESGKPITLVTDPATDSTNAAPIPCTAYPPALPRHSPLAT